MVYKVKKKAENNFYNVTLDNRDDKRFQFDFAVDSESKQLPYSYNWPYDFFSLVELAKIEAEATITRDKSITDGTTILTPDGEEIKRGRSGGESSTDDSDSVSETFYIKRAKPNTL
jgi:hypothetical protein